jgi:hypothetical protein
MVTFNRLFFRNFIPPSAAAAALPAQLDYTSSPVPFIVSRHGGQATYNLVVMHWTRPMLWVLQRPGTFWHAAREQGGIRVVGPPGPVLLDKPGLYTIKSFASDRGTATITDCYMPFDVDGCLTDQPFSTTLIYCPYTFKDSLRNPWVERVVVFHDVGLDRLVNSYRNPALVNRTVLYESCPGTRHVSLV